MNYQTDEHFDIFLFVYYLGVNIQETIVANNEDSN